MEQTIAFQSKVTNAVERDAYLARLPQGAFDGSLVIHHTAGIWQGTFEAVPAVDRRMMHS